MSLPAVLVLGATLLVAGCGGAGEAARPAGADLSAFEQASITVGGVPFLVWVARTPGEQEQGLSGAAPEQLAPAPDGTPRGMLFVFDAAEVVAFTMADTAVALDIAFVLDDGTIDEILPLEPLDPGPVVSSNPVRYALEVARGTFDAHGITAGDVLVP